MTTLALHLSDRFGRRPVAIAGLLVSICGGLLFGIAPSFTAGLAIRCLQELPRPAAALTSARVSERFGLAGWAVIQLCDRTRNHRRYDERLGSRGRLRVRAARAPRCIALLVGFHRLNHRHRLDRQLFRNHASACSPQRQSLRYSGAVFGVARAVSAAVGGFTVGAFFSADELRFLSPAVLLRMTPSPASKPLHSD
jgi:MFS family permease